MRRTSILLNVPRSSIINYVWDNFLIEKMTISFRIHYLSWDIECHDSEITYPGVIQVVMCFHGRSDDFVWILTIPKINVLLSHRRMHHEMTLIRKHLLSLKNWITVTTPLFHRNEGVWLLNRDATSIRF